MDKLAMVQAILACGNEQKTGKQSRAGSFVNIGSVYAIRTVTMIYTGRLIDFNEQEFLFDEVAWIPETERWADFAATGAHKEAEPFVGKVIIGRGGLLDMFEIPSVIRKQK